MFAQAGLAYNPPPEVVPNTRTALRLTELAREQGRHEETHDRLMSAYWDEARNIGDVAVLRELAAELGLEQVDEVLAGEAYADRVARSTAQANAIGVNAIPAFLLDRRVIVLGAQPRAVFEQAFERLAAV
jgi:predicted DsbA family dithiol-disulfide isomerase